MFKHVHESPVLGEQFILNNGKYFHRRFIFHRRLSYGRIRSAGRSRPVRLKCGQSSDINFGEMRRKRLVNVPHALGRRMNIAEACVSSGNSRNTIRCTVLDRGGEVRQLDKSIG